MKLACMGAIHGLPETIVGMFHIRDPIGSLSGITFDPFTTSHKALDFSGDGLTNSTSDFHIYIDSNNYWSAGAASELKTNALTAVGDVTFINATPAVFVNRIRGFTYGVPGNVYLSADNTLSATAKTSVLMGHDIVLGYLGNCTFNGTATVTKASTWGFTPHIGDMVWVIATTVADCGYYRVVSFVQNTSITVDRAFSYSGTDGDSILEFNTDIVAVRCTDGVNGQMLAGYSAQNKPLQIGGSGLIATTNLTAEDVTLGGLLNVDVSAGTVGVGVFNPLSKLSVSGGSFGIYQVSTDASNYERFAINTASGLITLAAETLGSGADNIDIALTPAGTGNVKFGTYGAEVALVAGYITIKDSGGTPRKLAVIA